MSEAFSVISTDGISSKRWDSLYPPFPPLYFYFGRWGWKKYVFSTAPLLIGRCDSLYPPFSTVLFSFSGGELGGSMFFPPLLLFIGRCDSLYPPFSTAFFLFQAVGLGEVCFFLRSSPRLLAKCRVFHSLPHPSPTSGYAMPTGS